MQPQIQVILTSTYQIVTKSGKSTIDLTVSCRNNILAVKTREINNIKIRYKDIEIDIENLSDKSRSHTPHFRTQDANQDEWCKLLHNSLSQSINSFYNEISKKIIDDQANLFVNLITTSASSFFSITEKSKIESNGWLSKDIKKSRNDITNANKRYKKDSQLPT